MDQEYQFASRVTLPLNSMVFGELPPLKKKTEASRNPTHQAPLC